MTVAYSPEPAGIQTRLSIWIRQSLFSVVFRAIIAPPSLLAAPAKKDQLLPLLH
jgi:hypothetical protein